jgi:hypothetical protein
MSSVRSATSAKPTSRPQQSLRLSHLCHASTRALPLESVALCDYLRSLSAYEREGNPGKAKSIATSTLNSRLTEALDRAGYWTLDYGEIVERTVHLLAVGQSSVVRVAHRTRGGTWKTAWTTRPTSRH